MNGRGDPSGYILMPIRTGSAHHAEPWTQNDLWVTRYNPAEMSWDLTQYVANHQPVVNADVVVWYLGSAHHHPRDEDGQVVGSSFQGVAQLMWNGFMLVPHNWFNGPIHWP